MTEQLLTQESAADPALRALYESAFPQEERIPWADLLRLVEEMPLEFAEYREGAELLGLTIVYPRPRLSWFWYFAVPEEKRGHGIGQRIFSSLLSPSLTDSACSCYGVCTDSCMGPPYITMSTRIAP